MKNTDKKKINLKHVIKSGTLIWGLTLIILMSLTNIGFNEKFVFTAWLADSLIIFGIIIFGMLMGESIGTDRQKEKHDGLYQRSLKEWNIIYDKVKDKIVFFNQFYQWFLPEELFSKKMNFLISHNVDVNKAKIILENCDSNDLFELKSHAIEKNGIFIRKLNEHEIEPVEKVLSGKIILDAPQSSYFLTALGFEKTCSVIEEGNIIARIRIRSRRNKRIIKIISSLAISLVFSLFTTSDFINGNDTEAWFNLISRICVLFTSFVAGWGSAIQDVKLQAQMLLNKIRILTMFDNALINNLFQLKTEDELAKEEYEKYKQEKAEALNNICEPELIDDKEEMKYELVTQ